MFQLSVLVSGSKGNAVLIRTAETLVLLDAGVSAKTIYTNMEELGIDRRELRAVVVSHEHSDHTRGVGAALRQLKIPLYINRDTLAQCQHRIGKLPLPVQLFETGYPFAIGDLQVHPFSSSHDAADSCNFTFQRRDDPRSKLGIATDLGYPTALAVQQLKNCTTLVLESNHDERLLMEGPYEWPLKQRIKSITGHLSNLQAVGVVSQILHQGLQNLILAHLSEINNDPQLACRTMQNYLDSMRSQTKLMIAGQYQPTPLIDV
ncbi:MAG TPA: MBL fold metallo-hydrolase [Candidatus Syntrophosphaera sp.]|nr:MBL fold metallo-hydrolase [Candidatus Syntrophosphaera sp.]